MDPLQLTPECMRALGYAAVDVITERSHDLTNRPVTRNWTREKLEDLLREPAPLEARDPLEVLQRVVTDVLPACTATDHPRFFSYVPSPGNYVAAIADLLASGANVFAGHWLAGAAAAQIELVVLDWLRELFGLPSTAGGILSTGGTQATLTAIHAARADRAAVGHPDSRIYVTNQTHSVIVRGLTYLGFTDEQIHRVPTTSDHRMDSAALDLAIATDRLKGKFPLCVVATAGTTGSGAVDPLEAIAEVCQRNDVWFHVDAAYGGAAVLSPKAAGLLIGLERADSIAVDPHKWWFQPYEIGCTLVRDVSKLRRAYSMEAEILSETRLAHGPVNFYDYGPQLTRSFRALKLWMTIQTFGLDALRQAVTKGIYMAERAERLLGERPHWQVVTAAQLGVVTFRPLLPRLDADTVDALVRQVAQDTVTDGYALVLTTDLGCGPVLRMCTIHPQTTEQDVESTIDMLETLLSRRMHDKRLAG